MAITLKDIANELNLSINTVSHALRDMPDISQKTKNRVCETAARMGYMRNLAASQLRSNKSNILGMVITDINNPVFAKMITGAENTCKNTSYTIMIGNSNENDKSECTIISNMLEHRVDGILLIPSMKNTAAIDLLKKSNIPYVILQRKFPGLSLNYVRSNDFDGGRIAAKHLYQNGHRSFLYISAPMYISSAKERYEGFLSYLRDKGLPDSSVQVLICNGTRTGSYKVIMQWLKKHTELHALSATAAFCFSDYVAYGVYSAFSECRLQIPNDISIIGYDNNELSNILLPTLTTVKWSSYQIGKLAAELLFKLINFLPDDPPAAQEIILSPKLIIRDSTAKPF